MTIVRGAILASFQVPHFASPAPVRGRGRAGAPGSHLCAGQFPRASASAAILVRGGASAGVRAGIRSGLRVMERRAGCRLGPWMLLLLLFPVQGRQKESGGLRAGPSLQQRLRLRSAPEAHAPVSGPRRAEDAVWLQRELGGRQQAGASRGVWASASGPGPWTVTHLQEQGVVGREGCPLFHRRKLFRVSLAHTLGERVMSKTWHWVLYGAQFD